MISPQDLFSRIKKGKPIPAILLLGDEPYLRDQCRAELIDHYVPEAARAWALSRFSADRGEVQAALDQAQSLPMLSPQQVIFLEDAGAIEEYPDKKRETAVAQLESYLADPAPFTVLVLEAAHLDQRMRLAKLLAEAAVVVEVSLRENSDRAYTIVALAKTIAKDQGVDFEPGAAEDLAESVGGSLQRLKTEIDKLSTYVVEEKLIRREDVARLVISERLASVWEMADMLAARQGRPALDFLDRLLRDGEEPLSMLGAMAWMYRKLIEASDLKGAVNGWQAARVLQMNPQKAELAVRNARKISKPRLLAGLQAMQRADDRLKGSREDPRTIMEFLISELTLPDSRPAAK